MASVEETTTRTAGARGLEARAVTVTAGGQTILRGTSITVPVGKLVALIGPSGSGKSTLLRALAGVTVPTAGSVDLDGHSIRLRSTDVGYVPFGTLLHPELTVREALRYAAELRLPAGTTAAELDERVDEVLAQLQMTDRADHRVATLSDGQKRRASCGAELVGRPPVLLLDEPATGLDAVLEARMMRLLRRLADEGRGVLVATHATSSLGLCDQVAVMAPGGELRFVGTPQEMLTRFGVSSYDEVYEALDLEGAPAMEDEPFPDALPGPPPAMERKPFPPLGRQTTALAARYATCTWRDRRSLAILVGQAPIIGLGIGLAMPPNVFDNPTLGPYYKVTMCFLLLVGAIWLGIITACREIVKERAIVDREVAVGVRFDAYLLAKCAVLFPMVAGQVTLLLVAAMLLQPIAGGPAGFGQLLVVCVAAGWAAVAMGLWLSAAVQKPDQATSSVPLLLIPQLLFAGAVIPYATMVAPVKAVANLMISRWALTGMGNSVGLDGSLSNDFGAVTGFEPDFYATPMVVTVGILVAGTLLMLSATGMTLDRRLSAAR
ncbi:ATP-binding cassette domain-containing protein [Conexibacter sp. W3-3-2]|uniref:ABC transporter ATP-binding protein/permease n=1 Tax=Conexibacter sp. W3-3-2 TaxID=2675227 RepID=UPI0012B9188C|nr:ATP-binding cassette domain-containing protein [Conexibacter sp. W3-3-2]MTD46016.1 ATP-binding cassette domain-containing protein [Conexibacter sp. W3-3-2]